MLLVTHFRAEGPELSLSDLPKVTVFKRQAQNEPDSEPYFRSDSFPHDFIFFLNIKNSSI